MVSFEKKSFYISIIMSLAFGSIHAQVIKVMTYNIRFDNPDDGENKWDNRKESLTALINFYSPDIFGIQEGLNHQVDYIKAQCPEYAVYGVGRDDGKEKGEFSAIYFKKNRFVQRQAATIWLSTTPGKVSVGWDAAMERICSYVLLEEESTGQAVWVFNTHFDHIGKQARVESAKLITETIKAVNTENYPVFLLGDFNLRPEELPIITIKTRLADAYEQAQIKPYGPPMTFTGFDYNKKPDNYRIDYIFVSPDKIKVNWHQTIDDANNLLFPSDHFPVWIEAEIELK